MGLRILDPEKAATVLDGLGIETQTEARDDDSSQEPLARALRTHTDIVDGEALRTPSTRYRLEEHELVVHRTEAFLVQEYVGFLGIDQPKRLRTPAGITDLYLALPEGSEVVEAKRAGSRRFVREALAQLLDYAPHTPDPAIRLSALFPDRPADRDLELLHRYGVDCVHRTHPMTFERTPAPQEARASMMPVVAATPARLRPATCNMPVCRWPSRVATTGCASRLRPVSIFIRSGNTVRGSWMCAKRAARSHVRTLHAIRRIFLHLMSTAARRKRLGMTRSMGDVAGGLGCGRGRPGRCRCEP
ncbi:hypothetical protein [Streptomyces sp. NPDC060027]|uniref:hypothetical protein n=1 Tax=Streptomyces sp. NPDC060027 TaxID=3347040 RepID=UPI0036760C04